MLTTAEIREHLASRQYMPGWAFVVYDGRFEDQHLAIRADLPDAYQPGRTVTIQVENMLPPMPNTAYLDEWMVWRLCRIATHEVREWYRDTEGKPVYDPHAPFAERDEP